MFFAISSDGSRISFSGLPDEVVLSLSETKSDNEIVRTMGVREAEDLMKGLQVAIQAAKL